MKKIGYIIAVDKYRMKFLICEKQFSRITFSKKFCDTLQITLH